MIDLSSPNEWQHICPETGLVMPWYTKLALDEIVTWDLKGKVVWEYGCGASTLWWAAKCAAVYGVESDEWYYHASKHNSGAADIYFCNTSLMYAKFITKPGCDFDIIVIDGMDRDGCVPYALQYLKPGGALIFDNWMQPSVEVQSEETQRLLLAYPRKIFKEPTHADWQTLIVWKQKEITDLKLTHAAILPNGEHGIGFRY